MNNDWNAQWRWFPAVTYMVRPGGPRNFNGKVIYLDYIDLQEKSWIGDYEAGWKWQEFALAADGHKKRKERI